MNPVSSRFSKVHVLRLRPGDLLRESLLAFACEAEVGAGVVLSSVGSFSRVRLRLAGADRFHEASGPHEIVSATGTLSSHGIHLHVSVADAEGVVIGGHLSDGCVVHTTAELVIGELEGLAFLREPDQGTGYNELSAKRVNA